MRSIVHVKESASLALRWAAKGGGRSIMRRSIIWSMGTRLWVLTTSTSRWQLSDNDFLSSHEWI